MEITYNGGTQSYSVQMFYDNTKLEKGKKYTLAFFAYASADLTVTFNNKSYELIAGETELISVVYEHGSNVGYMGLSDFDAQFMGVKAETTIRISMVTWTEYEEEPAPANAIPNAQNQAMVLANPDTYYYWNDQNWCGSNVTVSQATMDDGVATLTYSGCNENCWFGMQFMYKNSKLTAGKPYKLTLKINASAAGNVTVNGKVFKLAVGDNEIAVEYYESANDYSMQVLFGVSSGEGNTGTVIAAGTFKISNIAWASTFTGEADKYYLIGKLGDNEVWYNVNAAYVFGAGDEQNTAILSNATLHAGDKIKAATGDGNVWFNWGESADNAACFDKDADGNAIIKADGTYNVYLSNRMLYIAKVQTEPKVVTVTVKWGIDGVTDTTITFTNGVASAYTVPTNEGYTLKAWRVYEEDGIHYVEVALNTVPTEDVTVYAVWEKPVVIVPGYYLLGNYGDYAPNGCWSVVGDDQPVMGTSEGLSAFGVYAFKANDDLMMWHQITSNDWQWVMWQAGECFDLTGGFKDHATIKADGRYYVYVYGDKAYITAAAPTVVKLTVNYNYGETPTVKEYYFVNGEVEGFVTPTRDGFTFKGFSTDAAGNDMVPMQAPQTNMTVYAQWEPEQQAPQTSVTIELDIAGASEWFFNDKAVVYIHVWYTDSTTATVAMTEQDGKYYFTTAADKTLAGLVFYRVNPNANPDEQNFIWNQSVDVTDFTNGYSFALTGEEENGKLKVETFNNGNGGNAGNDGGANGEGGAGQP